MGKARRLEPLDLGTALRNFPRQAEDSLRRLSCLRDPCRRRFILIRSQLPAPLKGGEQTLFSLCVAGKNLHRLSGRCDIFFKQ